MRNKIRSWRRDKEGRIVGKKILWKCKGVDDVSIHEGREGG